MSSMTVRGTAEYAAAGPSPSQTYPQQVATLVAAAPDAVAEAVAGDTAAASATAHPHTAAFETPAAAVVDTVAQ